jgi:hypothetical protein
MSNYRYTLRAIESGNVYEDVIFGVTARTAREEIWKLVLERERHRQYDVLFDSEEPTPELNMDSDRYAFYTYNPRNIQEELVSMADVMNMYNITDLKLESYCHGCVWDRPGQCDHMDCPTGCLHNASQCPLCKS